MTLTLAYLQARVATADLPAWATHGAANYFDGRVEPVVWDERVKCFIGEDPASLKDGDWATTYKSGYWKMIPRPVSGVPLKGE